MNDAELSLAVARIIEPEYEWLLLHGSSAAHRKVTLDNEVADTYYEKFSYKKDGCAFKMCVWLAKKMNRAGETCEYCDVEQMLTEGNPHRAIAEAIVEVSNDH